MLLYDQFMRTIKSIYFERFDVTMWMLQRLAVDQLFQVVTVPQTVLVGY